MTDVWHDAVRNGPSLYSASQRRAWSPAPLSIDALAARLAGQEAWVATDKGRVVGLMTVTREGYVDLAYVRPTHQGRGLFRRLFSMIEASMKGHGVDRMATHASLMARPAFEAVGFSVVRAEIVGLRGQQFRRFEMEKQLSPRPAR